MDNERWLPVVGFEHYEVSDHGRVRSLPRGKISGRILAGSKAGRGYLQVSLCSAGDIRKHYIHHLVAAAFIGPRPAGTEVLHGGSDFTDNRAVNLSYGSHSRNMRQTLVDGTNPERNRPACDHGHALTPDNVKVEPNGQYADGSGPKFRQRCRECLRLKSAADYVKWKARHSR